ncbi:MAG TPA: PP2C family serine/threonine-protein phosphatase, partial [Limnochordia bacterium]|nr:PP2C family serine/threonine-protein phosphatase [Limnochordia bacterium]
CSHAGSAHRRAGRPGEDRVGFTCLADGGLVLAVADGAGSAAHGAEGAERAVAACLAALTALAREARSLGDLAWWTDRLRAEVQSIHAAVGGEAAAAYAATLIGVGLYPGGAVAMQVGDGAAVVGTVDGRVAALTRPEHGEYVNETSFITSAGAAERAQIVVRPGGTREIRQVALFTDGIEPIAWNRAHDQPHAPFFAPLFKLVSGPGADVARLSAFLRSERVAARTDDDVTLLLASR